MKIAVSGAHRTGKSTLVAALGEALPGFATVDEPYYLLEAEGHVFADLPTGEDFEAQLELAIQSIAESEGDCVFDRCPADMLAYLIVLDEPGDRDLGGWVPRVHETMQQLDLIVFVPIEEPDRIAVPESGHPRLRRRVDDALRDIVLDDSWGFGVPALQVSGTPDERAHQVLTSIGTHG